jgi:hypothetical protein
MLNNIVEPGVALAPQFIEILQVLDEYAYRSTSIYVENLIIGLG